MKYPKDDYGMITAEHLKELIKMETDTQKYYEFIARTEIQEPRMWMWNNSSREEDIDLLASIYEGVFQMYPRLAIHLNGIFMKYFIRGLKAGEAKWTPNLGSEFPAQSNLPEPPEPDNFKDYYLPKEDDFK